MTYPVNSAFISETGASEKNTVPKTYGESQSSPSPFLAYRPACVIMASGMSKRFGKNKLLADFNGTPMIMRILTATDGLFARRVLVTRHPEIADISRQFGIEVVLHDLPHRSDTVRLGLEAIGDADGCMFCQGDQPLLRRETISSLLHLAEQNPESICRPRFGDTVASPVLFPHWAFEQLMHLPEGKGGGHIARLHPERTCTYPVENGYELIDADDPETFLMLSKLDADNCPKK